MTDVTELALLVSKAKASVFTLEYISQFEPADIDSDDVDLRLEVDGRDTGTNVSIVDECGQAAKVIGALVEALERKGEQRANWFQMAQKLGENLDTAEKRIAELESRSVKLPKPKNSDQGWKIDPEFINKVQDAIGYDDTCECWEGTPSMELVEAVLLAAAGIKVEAE
ncbi:ead/Ea22-like family protein [Klebsiella pneumoniae]|nr:ead/Ea22-like family protein [Klebsiella pneumoniae]